MRSLLAGLLALLAASAVTAQAPLLTPALVAEADLTPRQAEILRILRAEHGAADAQIAVADAAVLEGEASVSVALPGGGSVVLTPEGAERRGDRSLSWSGRAAGASRLVPLAATGLFVARGGQVTGLVRDGADVYTLRPLTGGLHAIARVDTRDFRFHGDDYPAFEQAEAERSARAWPLDAPAVPDDAAGGATVDILVVYTAAVAAAYADPAAFAQLSVDTANQTFQTSDVAARLALVAAYQTPTASGVIGDDLSALRTVGDGRFDEVHARRDAYGADLVAMLGSDYPGYCGLGYVNPGATYAFSVTDYTCAGTGFAFAHEVGHNFGASHDPYVTQSPAYAYGQGSVDLAGRWRTVMSYNDECAAAGFSCTTVGYWSSPDVTYPDAVAPVHVGPTGDAATRDNARLLDERGPTLAAFRATRPPPAAAVTPDAVAATLAPGATTTRTVTLRNAASSDARPLDWRATVVGTADECREVTVVEQTESSFYTVSAAGGSEFGQSVTAACTGVLRSVAPRIYAPGAPSEAWAGTMRLYAGTGTAGAALATRPASGTTPASGYAYLVVPFDVPVAQGSRYTWFLDLESGRLPVLYATTNPYAGGTRFRSGNGLPATATAVPADDAAFRLTFDPPARWATVAAPTGNAAPGSTGDVALTLSAAGLTAGTYALTLVLTTNDPAAPTVEVPVRLTVDGAVAADDAPDSDLALAAPRPNPAAGTTALAYALPAAGPVRISIVDLLGREVAVVHDGAQAAGTYAHTLDTRPLAPGVYVVRLAAEGRLLTQRLVVAR